MSIKQWVAVVERAAESTDVLKGIGLMCVALALFSVAYRHAPASTPAPFIYLVHRKRVILVQRRAERKRRTDATLAREQEPC